MFRLLFIMFRLTLQAESGFEALENEINTTRSQLITDDAEIKDSIRSVNTTINLKVIIL